MSQLTKKFAQVVGGVAAVGVVGGATAFGLSFIPENDAAATAPSSSDGSTSQQQPVPDVYFNLMTPLFPNDRYIGSVEGEKLSLNSTPDIITITADTSDAAVDQIIQGLRNEIIKNGGPVNRILFSSDGFTNTLADPLPNDECEAVLPDFSEYTTFCTTSITSILHAMVSLQNEEFPGHKAGEPLGRAVDIAGCDVFATQVGSNERLPAREISQLAGQLSMPVIASATLVGYNLYPWPIQNTGDFWAMLPNGNVSYLPGPRTQMDPADPGYLEFLQDDVAENEAWIHEDGFTIQNVTEPEENYPFSLVNAPEIAAVTVAGPAANSNGPETIPQAKPQRIVSVGPARKTGPGMG